MNNINENYLSRIGISNLENIRFNRLHNKFNTFQSQTAAPNVNDGTLSTYVVNGELYFSNNQLTEGGSITGGTGTISDSPFTITNGTITQKTAQPLQLQNQAISSISSIDTATITATTGTITNFFATSGTITNISGTTGTITNLAPETINLFGSTRTISNVAGITFSGLSTYINGLNNLTLSGTMASSITSTGTITATVGTITNLFSSTITTDTLNLTNLTISTLSADVITTGYLGSTSSTISDLITNKTVATNATITDLYTDTIRGKTGAAINFPENYAIVAHEIQVNNNSANAPIYSNEYYVGTKGDNPIPLGSYVQGQIGTVSNKSYTNFFVSPVSYYFRDLELNKGNLGTLSGLTTDVLQVEQIAIMNNVYCEQFYCSSDGGDLFEFFDAAGSLLMKAGQAYADYTLAKKMLKIGATALLAIGALSVAGNIIYNIATESSQPSASDYLDMAEEYGCKDSSGSLSFTILQNPIGVPDNSRTVYTFAYNPGYGRLTSGGYVQTEMAEDGIGSGPDTEFAVYGIINGHDKQRSIEFNQYDSVSQWNTGAKQGVNGAGVTRVGSQMWNRRLVAIDTSTISGQFQPRLRFHHEDNQIAYLSDITHTLTDYWEISGGYLQPNANSGVQGKIQINSNNINLYDDVYLSDGNNFNFVTATKGQISYNDTAKTLSFRNGDNTGEFIFNDYLDNARFKIDTANNRIEIPQGNLFFQESGDQNIYKAGTGTLSLQYNGSITAYMESGKGLSVPNAMYFDYTGGGTGAPPGGTLSGLYRVGNAPDDFLNFSGHKIADYRYGTTSLDLETPNLWVRSGYIYFDEAPNYTTNTAYIQESVQNLKYHVEANKTHSFEIGTSPLIDTIMQVSTAKTTINNDLYLDGNGIEFNATGTPATITNKLFRNGSDLIFETTTLTSTTSPFFTEANGTATSANYDFKFSQNLEVEGTLSNNSQYVYLGATSGGGHNMVFDLPANSNNSQITINSGQRFINYNANTDKGLYISHQGGTDSENNIQFQLHASPTTYVKITDTTTTFSNDIDVAVGKNLDINSGTLTVIGQMDIKNTFKVRSSNIATNVTDFAMSDTTATYSLSGGSNPDTFLFKDYNNDNVMQAKRNEFRIYNSAGNTSLMVQSANVSIYNPLDVNEIYSRSGTILELGLAGTTKMSINTTGRVEVADTMNIGGTGTQYATLQVDTGISTAGSTFTTYSYYFYSGLAPASSSSQLGTGSYSLGIHVNSWVNAWGYITFSDERIKKNIKPCDCGLDAINKLNVVEFEYIDKTKESGERCGFIAQEVEEILPHSVKTTTNFIPDYYKIVEKISDDCIILDENHGYNIGDKLKLINEDREYTILINNVDSQLIYYNVVGESGTVIIPDVNNKYFLYGKEVNNFKQIDNEYLNAISIKGVQELFRKNVELETKLKNLCAKLGFSFDEL